MMKMTLDIYGIPPQNTKPKPQSGQKTRADKYQLLSQNT